jgi:PAS domain S-box-containing protein
LIGGLTFALRAIVAATAGLREAWRTTAGAGMVGPADPDAEARFRRCADGTPTMLVMTDLSGQCLYANMTLQRFTGLPASALLGDGWLGAIHPEESASAALYVRDCLAAGENFATRLRFRNAEGGYFWHIVRGTPMRNELGRIVEWLFACSNIQELVDAREALAQINEGLEATVRARTAELAQLQKIDAIGQLTAGVAHDFNNLLQPIMGSLELLQSRLQNGDSRSQRLIQTGLQSTARAAALVQRLLAFARRQDLQPRPTDVGALLLELEELVRRSLGETCEVAIEIEPELPAARVDPNQLELAILNLAINSRDAMPAGGLVTISVRGGGSSEAMLHGLPPGRYVCVSVSDTGIGMDEATLARACEPFFSTKGVGRGTGLGLSMAQGLAAQSGGTLALRSTPGRGTTAEIWLPSCGEAAVPLRYVRAAVPSAVKAAAVLLVDDEELVRIGTTDMLTDIGYVVIQVGSSAEAIDTLRDANQTIDVMVTDYLMPGMNGADLAAEAARLRPGLPVLLVSGNTAAADEVDSHLPRLAKPFRQAEMAAEIARLVALAAPQAQCH